MWCDSDFPVDTHVAATARLLSLWQYDRTGLGALHVSSRGQHAAKVLQCAGLAAVSK